MNRHVEEDLTEPDQGRAREQRKQALVKGRKEEARGHYDRPEKDRIAHAHPVGNPARVHREQQRKDRVQSGENADHEGIRAQVQGAERYQHLAAAKPDAGKHRQEDDEID